MDGRLSGLLEAEHREIDAGIEAYVEAAVSGADGSEALARAIAALRRHIYLEEEFLFPPLRAAGMLPPVLVMLKEHGQIWRAMDAVASMSDVEPAIARERCGELVAQLAAHNAKEEPIIYPRGDTVLGEDAQDELRDFIEAGSMPDGWVCAQA